MDSADCFTVYFTGQLSSVKVPNLAGSPSSKHNLVASCSVTDYKACRFQAAKMLTADIKYFMGRTGSDCRGQRTV